MRPLTLGGTTQCAQRSPERAKGKSQQPVSADDARQRHAGKRMFHGVEKACRSFGGEMTGEGLLERGAVQACVQERTQPRQKA